MSNFIRILQIRKIQVEFAMHEYLFKRFSSYYENSFKGDSQKVKTEIKKLFSSAQKVSSN